MLTVKFQDTNLGCVSEDGYPLHLIDVVYSLNASGACGNNNQIQIVSQVWVDNRAATLAAANLAGYTIYDANDCTQCAAAGYYGGHDRTNPGASPTIIYLWNFKGNCAWEGSIQCGPTEIEVVFSTKKADVCNDNGVSTFVWIDDLNFTNATGVFETSGLGQINITVQQNICQNEFGCSTLYWFKEKGVANGPIKRLDGNQNLFVESSTCDVNDDPGSTTRYEQQLQYSFRERDICEFPNNVTVWTDASRFHDSTTMWSASSGNGRPSDGYYKSMVQMIGSSDPYYLFSAPSYTLDISNPTGGCGSADDGLDDDDLR